MKTDYLAVKRERFGDLADLERELTAPVPPAPVRKGREGMTRLEVLCLRVRSGRAA